MLLLKDIKIMQDYCGWCLRDISIQFVASSLLCSLFVGTSCPVFRPHKHIQMVALWFGFGPNFLAGLEPLPNFLCVSLSDCLGRNLYLQEVCDMRSDEWFPGDRGYKQRLYTSMLWERPWGQKPTGEDNSTQSRHCMANLLMFCMLRGKTLGDSEMKEGS